jgi:phenylacetate-CoA ligase
MRSEIEQAFDMHAVDIYGLSEVMGPGVANECVETKDGLHIWEDHFYPEIIDPVTGEVLPDGEMGELVFTSLTKEALPIIRYRTRDLTRLLPGTARSMRRMEKVTGRSDDMIILRGVNVFPDPDRGAADGDRGLAPHFQIELTREGRMDAMTVHVECTATSASEEARAASGKELAHHIKITARINVAEPGKVARSEQGQARGRQPEPDLRPWPGPSPRTMRQNARRS